jgi:AMMECR1 domain-containing protein
MFKHEKQLLEIVHVERPHPNHQPLRHPTSRVRGARGPLMPLPPLVLASRDRGIDQWIQIPHFSPMRSMRLRNMTSSSLRLGTCRVPASSL